MEARFARSSRRPFIISHRGFSAQYPENTLVAVRAATHLGVDYGEIEVQETADGKLAVFHDYRLDRICWVTGRVRDVTFTELRRLNPTIPSLAEVLRVCRDKAPVLIEIKGANPRKVAAEIERCGMEREVIVFSLSLARLEALAAANPRIARFGLIARDLTVNIARLKSSVTVEGLGVSRRLVTSPEIVDMIHRHGWEVVVWGVGVGGRVGASPEVVDMIRGHGWELFVWAVNRRAEMQRLASWGVDG